VLLGEPVVAGVESIEVGHIQLRLVARTLPGKQFDVGRELRLRAALALTQAGLVAPAMQVHPPDT
jgi:small conductance mechanosensitive channel